MCQSALSLSNGRKSTPQYVRAIAARLISCSLKRVGLRLLLCVREAVGGLFESFLSLAFPA